MAASDSKRWSVRALSHGIEPPALFCRGQPVAEIAGAGAALQPVEYLLAAVASCFALSCRAALAARRLRRIGYEVIVAAEKAPEPPSRLKEIAVSVSFSDGVPEEDAAALVKEAEALCTITNTLLACPNIVVTGRSSIV